MDDGKKSAIVVYGQWSIVYGLEKKMNDALLSEIKYDANGLVPAIVQDIFTKDVLMMAWMNAEALQLTLEKGETVFWSRSRREIWHKGATSGNVQKVVEVRVDCDADTLLVLVEPAGPACHTGERTCFYRSVGRFKVAG